MDLRTLEIIDAVARHRSFSKAAEEVFLSTAAVSAAVNKAEERIGMKLFERTTRSVSLTPLLRRLLPRIRLLLKEHNSLMRDIDDNVRLRTGHVAIGCLSSIAVHILPRAIARCRAKFPHVEIELRDAATAAVYEDVASGRTEFALVGPYESRQGLTYTPLLDDRLVLICSPTHALAQRKRVRVEDLVEHDFILLSRDTGIRAALDDAIGPMDMRFRVKHEVTQLSSLIGMVQEGLGISFVPSLSLPQIHATSLVAIGNVQPRVSRQIGMLRRTDRPFTPAAQAAMECVTECFDDLIRPAAHQS